MGTSQSSTTHNVATEESATASPASAGTATRARRSELGEDVANLNLAVVVGQLASEPQSRTLPSGTVAVSFALTVRSPGAKTTSVPVVWYDPPQRIFRWLPGEQIIVHGAIVRRFFRGGSGLGSATEVVVERAELLRHRAKAERVATRAGIEPGWHTITK